jgi:hypothetical protein
MNETLPGTSAPASADSLRDLLARVASGDLDPGEAARLLDEDPAAPTHDRSPVASVTSDRPPTALVIRAGGIKLTVVADPTVDTLVADGPHALHREGGSLVLAAPRADGYQTQPAPRFLGWVPTTWTAGRGEKVTVRVNPALPLTVDATACGVEILGVKAALTLAGSASSVKVRDLRGSLHGSLTMGSVSVAGILDGPSDLSCELGSADVRLLAGSDVDVNALCELGSVKLAGGTTNSAPSDGHYTRQTMSVGAGTHPFELTVRMGSATVVAG